jgi:hypothetical protein
MNNPERTLGRALGLGTSVVTALCLALNLVFIYAEPLESMKRVVAIGALAASNLFGSQTAELFGKKACCVSDAETMVDGKIDQPCMQVDTLPEIGDVRLFRGAGRDGIHTVSPVLLNGIEVRCVSYGYQRIWPGWAKSALVLKCERHDLSDVGSDGLCSAASIRLEFTYGWRIRAALVEDHITKSVVGSARQDGRGARSPTTMPRRAALVSGMPAK